jgi:hypothetical protein
MTKLLVVAALVWGVSARAAAQTATPEVPPPPEAPPVDEAEIARALQADQAAKTVAPSAEPPPTAAPVAVPRGGQSLNPDISAIVDFAAGWFSDASGTVKSGDDPQSTGFKVQEVELALQQVVDPYFRADLYLTIPNLSGIEVEEAVLTTTALPGNLQLRAGIFRAGLGRQNAQHLHLQDFTRRPALNAAFLGVDGLRAPGAEASWLVPGLPFYLMLSGAAFSVDAAEADLPLQTFGGGDSADLSYVGSARAFFPAGESTSIYLGLNYARGKASQRLTDPTTGASAPSVYDGARSNLYGADLYVKWKPANQAETYASLAWQTEYFLRQLPGLTLPDGRAAPLEGGLYSQLVAQVQRRIFVGLRGELLGVPQGDNVHREYAGALSLTWALSEFARLRAYGELREARRAPEEALHRSEALFLQLEAAIGAHGAHPF